MLDEMKMFDHFVGFWEADHAVLVSSRRNNEDVCLADIVCSSIMSVRGGIAFFKDHVACDKLVLVRSFCNFFFNSVRPDREKCLKLNFYRHIVRISIDQ